MNATVGRRCVGNLCGLWAAFLLGVTPGWAESPAIQGDFDQLNFNVAQVLDQARLEGSRMAQVHPHYPGRTWWERDCATFTFRAEDPPLSDAVWLKSYGYMEECDRDYGHPGYPGGPGFCRRIPLGSYTEKVQVELVSRKAVAYPWEVERFDACLEGRWLDLDQDGAYDYQVNRNGGLFKLSPGAKRAMNPDPSGISVASWSNDVGRPNLRLSLSDRWAQYYAGEQTQLKVKLYRSIKGWFDTLILEKEWTLPSAAAYEVHFGDYAKEFNYELDPGKQYYVEWGFKRIGKISKPRHMKQNDTGLATYDPPKAVAVR